MHHTAVGPAQPWGLPLELKIMPQYFRDLGYETHMIGKVEYSFIHAVMQYLLK